MEKNVLCPHKACVYAEGMAWDAGWDLTTWFPFLNPPCTYRGFLVANTSHHLFIRLTRLEVVSLDLVYCLSLVHVIPPCISQPGILRVSLHAIGEVFGAHSSVASPEHSHALRISPPSAFSPLPSPAVHPFYMGSA